jgi:hypothetical protein
LQQVCHKLLKTALLQLCVNNLRQTCWKQHCCSSVPTACNRLVENSIAAALSQQLVTDLLTGRCGSVRTDRYKASERIQISACWQQVLTDLLQICSDLRETGCIETRFFSAFDQSAPVFLKGYFINIYISKNATIK